MVNSGWGLNELRPVGLSLEDIFLQLTAAEQKDKEKAQKEPAKQEEGATR